MTSLQPGLLGVIGQSTAARPCCSSIIAMLALVITWYDMIVSILISLHLLTIPAPMTHSLIDGPSTPLDLSPAALQ